MKLVIHAGTHKTGTTTFQLLCWSARDLLLGSGVFYPELRYRGRDVFQHSPLVWDLQAGSRRAVFGSLCAFYFDASHSGCSAVLLSGEDFENFIVDLSSLEQFEQIAYDAGFDALEWVFVSRDPVDYFRSVYSELSKHRVCLSAGPLAASVIRSGWFALSTETLNYFFAIDFARLIRSFERRSRGFVRVFGFQDFVADRLGFCLLEGSFGLGWTSSMQEHLRFAESYGNRALPPRKIEMNYLENFLSSGFLEAQDVILMDRVLVERSRQLDDAIALLRQHFSPTELWSGDGSDC